MVDFKSVLKTAGIFAAGAGSGYVFGKKHGMREAMQFINGYGVLEQSPSSLVSMIIDAHDHDLTTEEERMAREFLGKPGVLREYLSMIEIVPTEQEVKESHEKDELHKAAKQKIEAYSSSHPSIGSLVRLEIMLINLSHTRRQNAYYRYILKNDIADIVRTVERIDEQHSVDADYSANYQMVLETFGLLSTYEEDAAYGVNRMLNRKRAQQAGKRALSMLEEDRKTKR